MRIENRVLGHPSRSQLVTYAENLVDGGAPVSRAIAAHVAACPQCSQELAAIRASLEFTSSADDLAPSLELTGQILTNARTLRNHRRQRRGIPVISIFKAAAFAAGVIAVAAASFGFALSRDGLTTSGTALPENGALPRTAAALTTTSEKDLERVASEVRMLSDAVRPANLQDRSPEEIKHLRAVQSMDADIAAARAALERNPGCERASSIVNANLKRQAATLRDLYAGGSL